MTKKSNMVKAGKAAQKKKAAERQAQQEQDKFQRAMSPLRLSDLVPEELYGLKLQGLRHAEDPELPTIMEIKEGRSRRRQVRSILGYGNI